MHEIQKKILELSKKENLEKLTLRAIADKIGEKDSSPQKIKHHIEQLVKKGFSIYKVMKSEDFVRLPVIGVADCGEASIFAEQNFQGFVTISKKLLKQTDYKNLFAIKAEGDSMNNMDIYGKKIENGDFAIIDNTRTNPQTGNVVLAIVENKATIKKFVDERKTNHRIVLMPNSTKVFNPIYIHEDDDFSINGTVVDIIKKPNLK